MTISIRVRYEQLGGHVHCRIYSSEHGEETTHGQNTSSPVIFRPVEFEAFRATMNLGAAAVHDSGRGRPIAVEFVEAPVYAVPEGHRA